MKFPKLFSFLSILTCLAINTTAQKLPVDVEGHRGCRGVMPENSIPAFIKAIRCL